MKEAWSPPEPQLVLDHTTPPEAEQQLVAGSMLSPFNLSQAEHTYVMHTVAGMPHDDAVYRAQLPANFRPTGSIIEAIQYIQAKQVQLSTVSREAVTEMFMKAYHCAESAGEMVAAAKEIGQLHDLYPAKKTKNMNLNANIKGKGKFSRMSDEQLTEHLGVDLEPRRSES